jgi:hypothetical protein
MIGGSEPTRLLDLRLLLRLKDRPVRARNRNCVLPKGCAGQSENKRNRTPAAELDFGSEANHAISDYQTVFAAVPTVKQNQPRMPMPLNNQLRKRSVARTELYALTCRAGASAKEELPASPKYLPIFSRDVLNRIATGDESWEEMVPPQVAEIIRRRGFFGYKKP